MRSTDEAIESLSHTKGDFAWACGSKASNVNDAPNTERKETSKQSLDIYESDSCMRSRCQDNAQTDCGDFCKSIQEEDAAIQANDVNQAGSQQHDHDALGPAKPSYKTFSRRCAYKGMSYASAYHSRNNRGSACVCS